MRENSHLDDMSNYNKNKDVLNKRLHEDQSKVKLKKIITTKLRTSFIGALSSFEETFGIIWGYGIDERDMTREQLKWRELWESCRTSVLNNGNHQIRACDNEFLQYVVSWNRHQNILKKKEDLL